MGYPSVYPMGTTIYTPDKCWNGYTIFQGRDLGAVLIDMNGNVAKLWKGLHGMPNTILPGGYVMGNTGERNPAYGYQDKVDLVQVDWDGNIVWKFDKYDFIEDPGEEPMWMVRQHHDYQREGNTVGYYAPGMEPLVDRGNTLILCHKNLKNPEISDKLLMDDAIIEVTWDGEIIWEWIASDHFDELGFSEEAKNAMCRFPNMKGGAGDWMHMNAMSSLGPNKWYDSGDERFHPDNIIWDGRQTNIIAITAKKTGKIVWKLGPDYTVSPQTRKLGQIIGQHHAHMIPGGLPGEGNILIFDNGGWAGYGAPNPGSARGHNNALRDYSRVLEFDPTTLELVWQYTPREAGFVMPADSYKFYSGYISSAQRLPSGNTLITEGADGRIFELTPGYEIVWEYLSPYFGKRENRNEVYRAYRVPYSWIPQIEKPEEISLPRLQNSKLRVTDFMGKGVPKQKEPAVTEIKGGVRGYWDTAQQCVIPAE
ncbi:aryl-sulfate sulfotransferase [Thermodesulfobacteriota bacterium]